MGLHHHFHLLLLATLTGAQENTTSRVGFLSSKAHEEGSCGNPLRMPNRMMTGMGPSWFQPTTTETGGGEGREGREEVREREAPSESSRVFLGSTAQLQPLSLLNGQSHANREASLKQHLNLQGGHSYGSSDGNWQMLNQMRNQMGGRSYGAGMGGQSVGAGNSIVPYLINAQNAQWPFASYQGWPITGTSSYYTFPGMGGMRGFGRGGGMGGGRMGTGMGTLGGRGRNPGPTTGSGAGMNGRGTTSGSGGQSRGMSCAYCGPFDSAGFHGFWNGGFNKGWPQGNGWVGGSGGAGRGGGWTGGAGGIGLPGYGDPDGGWPSGNRRGTGSGTSREGASEQESGKRMGLGRRVFGGLGEYRREKRACLEETDRRLKTCLRRALDPADAAFCPNFGRCMAKVKAFRDAKNMAIDVYSKNLDECADLDGVRRPNPRPTSRPFNTRNAAIRPQENLVRRSSENEETNLPTDPPQQASKT